MTARFTSFARNGITQMRPFQWSGKDLTSATNPENGTVAYIYDAAHHVTERIDALGPQVRHTYDSDGRLTARQHLQPGGR